MTATVFGGYLQVVNLFLSTPVYVTNDLRSFLDTRPQLNDNRPLLLFR